MKQKIKIKILKFLITNNNFYDRERLMQLSERPLFSVIYCGIYRKFLKLFVEKKSKNKISNAQFVCKRVSFIWNKKS